MMTSPLRPVFLGSSKRTPFTRVDGPLSHSKGVIELSAHVLKAATAGLPRAPDGVIWGSVAQHVTVSNLAREAALDAGLPWDVPAHSVVMACSTSMVAAIDAAGFVARGRGDLLVAGGVELMSHVQIGLSQELSDAIRRFGQARTFGDRLKRLSEVKGLGLDVPKVQNRITRMSMGEHQEETNRTWKISREAQDAWALQSHQRAVAAQQRGFFAHDLVATEGATADAFPRPDSTLQKLSTLRPAFVEGGTLTAGNSSPLTDGAASLFIASEPGLASLPAGTPVVEWVDFEVAAIDARAHGLLMAPGFAVPRLLARNGLRYADVALYEIHEAFAAQVLTHLAAFEDAAWLSTFKAEPLGPFPVERVNPNGGSVALGHPFGATGARILSQATRELAAMPGGSFAVVSICADGGLGTAALLRKPA